jgi:O-antigen/teichoic acid export membrane protein
MLLRLAKHATIYSLSFVVVRVANLLLLPLYARHLSAHDLGVLAVCVPFTSLLTSLGPLAAAGSISMLYHKVEPATHRRLLQTVCAWYLLAPASLFALLVLLGPGLAPRLSPTVPWYPYLLLAAAVACFTPASDLTASLLNASEQSQAFTLWSSFSQVTPMLLIAYLVAGRQLGALGGLWGQLLGAGLVAVVSFGFVLGRCWPWQRPYVDWALLRRALHLCLPFIPFTLALTVINLSDRWILSLYVPLADVGVYNLAYMLGMTISALGQAINLAYTPMLYREGHERAFRAQLPALLLLKTLLLAWAVLGISLLAPEILQALTRPEYAAAAAYVPWIASSYGIFAMVLPLISALQNEQKTRGLALMAAPPAVLNVAMNLVLIKHLGVQAASISTLAAFVLLAVMAHRVGRTLEPLPYPLPAMLTIVLAALITGWLGTTYLSTTYLSTASLARGAAAKLMLLVSSAAITATATGLTRSLRAATASTPP